MNKLVYAVIIGAAVYNLPVLAGQHQQDVSENLTNKLVRVDALTVMRKGQFDIDMAPKDALPLFTAPGETLWIPSWRPQILHGDGYESGTVFLTEHGEHITHWYVVNFDRQSHQAQYLRVTPGVDMGSVHVRLKANEQGGTRVMVEYQLTALSDTGKHKLQHQFSPDAYEQMMRKWREMIEQSMPQIDAHLAHNQ